MKKAWMVESVCPHCNKVNAIKIPVGEQFAFVHCDHCTHGYDYIHVVREHIEVEE
jgi:Zn ribbon nucleic-acid-binding protein